MKRHILIMTLVWSFAGYAQDDFNSFPGIRSQGQLPSDFMDSWADKYERRLEEETSTENEEDQSLLTDFWQEQYRNIDAMIQGGRFSFGDEITLYLNEITDKVLQNDPELRKQIRVYLMKSPSVNAFSIADGIIVINTGLVAHVKSEAELAFVLAHEVAHFKEQHVFESFKKAKAEDIGGWFSPSVNPIKRFDDMMARTREHELEADLEGLKIYQASPYSLAAIDTAFTTLHESYVTYGRKPVGKDFLATDIFTMPPAYFRDEVDPIEKEEDYFDETHNHPNIASRRLALDSARGEDYPEGSYFLLGEERFHKMQELARMELVREKVVYGWYASALYDIYVLRDQYPNSKFLDLAEVRAIYGLASFKAVDRISDVAESGFRVDGPIQQVNHILRQFNCEQLNSLALHYTYRAKAKYPEEKFLNEYINNLSRYLMIECDVEANEFEVEGEKLPEFTAAEEDFDSPRQYLRAQQSHYRDFHKYLLAAEYDSGILVKDMGKHQAYKDSLQREHFLTEKERNKRDKEIEKREEESGPGLKVDQLIMLDPTILVVNYSDNKIKQLEALKKEQTYKEQLPGWAEAAGIKTELLYVEEMSEEDIDAYNDFSLLEEWVTEATAFGRRDIIPTNLDIREKSGVHSRYLCRIIGIVAEGDKDFYYFGLFDINKGELLYSRFEEMGRTLTITELERETIEDLQWISR
jgi:hypothetical protein